MINIYYMDITPFEQEEIFQSHLLKMEEERKAKILRTRSRTARVRSLAAGSLLHEAVCRELACDGEGLPPLQVGYGAYGKPFLTEYPQIHFNLSHSGRFVVCAVGQEELGVDIQEHSGDKQKVAERFFTESEKRMLDRTKEGERSKLFFRLWSIKESYLKLTGRGIGQGLGGFEILLDDQRITADAEKGETDAFFSEFGGIKGYSASLCTRNITKERWRKAIIGCKDRQIKLM